MEYVEYSNVGDVECMREGYVRGQKAGVIDGNVDEEVKSGECCAFAAPRVAKGVNVCSNHIWRTRAPTQHLHLRVGWR